MNWICPVCKADDNEEYSIRCSCGYIFDEKSRSAVNWTQSKMPGPSLIPLKNAPKMPKTSKQKVGHFIYISSIVALLICVVLLLTTKWFPTKKAIAVIISASAYIITFSSLLTDDIGVKGVGTVKRTENPAWFWTQFVFQVAIAVAFMLIAIYVKE